MTELCTDGSAITAVNNVYQDVATESTKYSSSYYMAHMAIQQVTRR